MCNPCAKKKPKNLLQSIVLVIGFSGVGRTSLIDRIVNGSFDPNTQYSRTDEYLSFVRKNQGHTVSIRFAIPLAQKIQKNFQEWIDRALMVVVVLDCTDVQSTRNLSFWCYALNKSNKPFFIVANHSDENEREITKKSIRRVIDDKHVYLEVSAKTGKNMNKFKEYICELVYKIEMGYSATMSHSKESLEER